MTTETTPHIPEIASGAVGGGSDELWYKDVVIYELHVRAFADSNGDGIGDFRGLTSRLDYLQQLGVTALWLLPFYPSPLKDAGYDISDYTSINPDYGTMGDFTRFVREAHRRGMRVITELVVNHTSDQHPWFQRARSAPAGSPERDWYVWSDDETKYSGTRIIFTDTETSNWAWDPVAGQYYWHRFFSHQPDLNYENPEVRRGIERVMKFWFDKGVDGMRLDAVPYLREREGTNNENLPETHEVLKLWRAYVDEYYPDRMLLAEANQWPEDVREYFGDDDECHMAFHFPVMPRLFMALRQEDRRPIVDIMELTPDIPPASQWAVFLRNHDELTLEMVTDEERDYMYSIYATDPRMRVNVGIRRRLAPLLDNNRRAMELLHGLLYSLPGTPILYYGDEIGMGDNIYLGDRDGVRTPMQWSGDRNGGFSKADPQRLYLPLIADPLYGFQAVNVEAQERSASSFLNWQRRMIAIRGRRTALGRGDLTMLHPTNRSVLAFIRRYGDEVMLVVANLSRFVQPVELDLSEFAGMRPIEVIGQTPFPPIDEHPYFLTLGPHNFYWLDLHQQDAEEYASLEDEIVVAGDWSMLLRGAALRKLERERLPDFIARQRWFGGKAHGVDAARLRSLVPVEQGVSPSWLAIADVDSGDETVPYVVPVAIASGRAARALGAAHPEAVISAVRSDRGRGVLYDATASERFSRALLELMAQEGSLAVKGVEVRGQTLTPFAAAYEAMSDPVTAQRLTLEQSNTSIRMGDQLMLKLLRRLEPAPSPEVTLGEHLNAWPDLSPRLAGVVTLTTDAAVEGAPILTAHELLVGRQDAWLETLAACRHFLDEHVGEDPPSTVEPGGVPPEYAEFVRVIGERTALLHHALATTRSNPAFEPQPLDAAELEGVVDRIRARLDGATPELERLAEGDSEMLATQARDVLRLRDADERLRGLAAPVDGLHRIHVHGDYHLGQLLASDDTFYILDFGGAVGEPIEERRKQQSAFLDLAGMLRSFSYAGYTAGAAEAETIAENEAARRRLDGWVQWWIAAASSAFLDAYFAEAGEAPFVPADPADRERLLTLFLIDKALNELAYESAYRPDWVRIPLGDLAALVARLEEPAAR